MKRWILLAYTAIAPMLFSCNHSDSGPADTELEGSWLLIAVKDVTSGTIIAKPASEPGDVTVNFCCNNLSAGQFSGTSPSNVFNGEYNKGANQSLRIHAFSTTKVAERPWGTLFATNIDKTVSHRFDNNDRLQLMTPEKILFFQKR